MRSRTTTYLAADFHICIQKLTSVIIFWKMAEKSHGALWNELFQLMWWCTVKNSSKQNKQKQYSADTVHVECQIVWTVPLLKQAQTSSQPANNKP